MEDFTSCGSSGSDYWVKNKNEKEDGYFQEECSHCSYNDIGLSSGKVCVRIDFKDGDSKNWLNDNIRLLCANCYYSFNAYFPSAKKFCK